MNVVQNLRCILRNQQLLQNAYATASIRGVSSYTEMTQCDGVREITLNEAKTRNSLSLAMMDSILENLTKDINNEELRCIILSANGPVWSAGHNLKELANSDECEQTEVFNKLTEIIMNIYQAPVPVIAKVNGLAAAAGCQLVASCDIVVCSDKSSFSTPGANFGIFCSTPGIAVSRVMPRLKSSYMVLTGLPIKAQDANAAGLVSVVVPENQLDEEVSKIAASIISKSRAVIALGKSFYYKQLGMNIRDAYTAGAEKMTENLNIADGVEGLKSFLEKRKPNWTHK
ncbi:enoyl-CoA hydratase domain-containing protein 3, mitochondrial isoform X2 [Teleopsis dalmanni]|uniref:enoyl-CoA hydratase domain-containing protein 3, mitochondrial isoform X2 n=1 Tax=Teleopsis dalmanni TaxID=139649 RepID=UPI0018CC8E53|nr:enoyl-CoA hydratase domain-containing protein 3, mitochondrial isoform X2 [Teleopsis dalmanni]